MIIFTSDSGQKTFIQPPTKHFWHIFSLSSFFFIFFVDRPACVKIFLRLAATEHTLSPDPWHHGSLECLRYDFTFAHINADLNAFHIWSAVSLLVNIPRGENKRKKRSSSSSSSFFSFFSLLITIQPPFAASSRAAHLHSASEKREMKGGWRGSVRERERREEEGEEKNRGRKGWVCGGEE